MRKTKNQTKLFYLIILPLAIFGAASALYLGSPAAPVQAADSDFSNGITVDSTLDTADDNISDNICDDGDGNCTLRAAIEEANDTAGTQTINFNISGAADYTIGGQSGYTIAPQTALPGITGTVIINGYSQPNSLANTAVAPAALNGRLLIEIDGTAVVASGADGLSIQANSSAVRGLVINNFDNGGGANAIAIGAGNVQVQGNYLGTEPNGTAAAGNDCGICQGSDGSTDLLVGGLDPEDRNLISGNELTGSSPNTDANNWIYQGNYIGVSATGMTALPNAQTGGSGGLSLDNSDGHIVGGSATGAINVISGNNSMGIAPHLSNDLLIEGNHIGVGRDGTTSIPNGSTGINASESVGVTIRDNTISNNGDHGIALNTDSLVLIVEGNTVANNDGIGISIIDGSGNATVEDNTIDDNSSDGIYVGEADTVTLEGNEITDANGDGIEINALTNGTITSNIVESAVDEGIRLYDSGTVDVSLNELSLNGERGIYVTNSDDLTITDNDSYDNDEHGISVSASSANVSIEDNIVTSNGNLGIYASTITNLEIIGNNVTESTQSGINLDNQDGALIEDNLSDDNTQAGIVLANGSAGNTVTNNQANGNGSSGINATQGSGDNVLIGNTALSNTQGITIDDSSNNQVGGISADARNLANDNSIANIVISGFTGLANDNTVQGNYIGVDENGQIDGSFVQGSGVNIAGAANDNLVGGTAAGEANLIAGNDNAGVLVNELEIIGITTVAPGSNSILGNIIVESQPSTLYGISSEGLGIDLQSVVLEFDGMGVVPTSVNFAGVTPNDASDPDTGPNGYINFPVINSAEQNLLDLNLNLDLDAEDSPTDQYRVEIFANDQADPSNHGEGQTYLGYTNIAPGADQDITIDLPSGTNLTGKVLSATTTAVDNTNDSGFGATSEFSEVLGATIIALPDAGDEDGNASQGDLGETGQNIRLFTILAAVLLVASVGTVLWKAKKNRQTR